MGRLLKWGASPQGSNRCEIKVNNCPCKSSLQYKNCCQRFHTGKVNPATALELMRSRYAAYAMRLVDYIMNTTHSESPLGQTNKVAWKKDLLRFAEQTRFDDLKIVDFVDGEETATVTFTAVLRQGSRDASFGERSKFFKVAGKWFYYSAEPAESSGKYPIL